MPRLSELKSPHEIEAEVLAFWKEHDTFRKSLARPAPKGDFVFYEGPPTANGMPHNGHVLTRAMKDLYPRYRAMRGYRVDRKGGWDTHGLPVEVEVEKELGIHGKAAIEAYGLEPFSRKCIQSVFTYTREWEELTDKIGFWLDQGDAYATYHRPYVESVWWALSELFRKGLLYQDYKVVWWWPQGGTALSSGEVGEGYRTVDDPSVYAKFRVSSATGELPEAVRDALGTGTLYFLAWTTTPWTLPSNVALAVNPEFDYDFVRVGDDVLVAARGLAPEGDVLHSAKGAELLGWTYVPLYTWAKPEGGRSYLVVTGDHVELGAGTGIVHTAPAFGEVDFQVRKDQGLGFLQLVQADGTFPPECTIGAGKFCKDADKDILRDLKERGLVHKSESIRHEYPFCPRADNDPLIQYARPAWFIRTTSKKDEALANNAAVDWHPPTIRDGRFGDFLRNNVDWALSRERFWGTPLPIWICGACGQKEAFASTEALSLRGATFAENVDRDLQIHRPWIDRVTVGCPCGGTMTRVTEVIDCWFDSGCMPFAQWGFPHAPGSAEKLAHAFPADFISEAIDQTRGWFYSLLMVSTLLFDDTTCATHGLKPGFPRPYKSCIVLGHVCDADGKKESKSKGNYTSPDLVLKGNMRVRVLPDATLKPGQVGMKAAQVKSLGLDPAERLRTPEGLVLEVVVRPVKGKDTVHLSVEDAAVTGENTALIPPFAPPGADAFRWLFYSQSPPWSNTRLSLKAILEGQREFLLRLKNVHQFFVLNAAGYVPAPPSRVHVLDRWILHELDQLTRDVSGWMDEYKGFESARAISAFVDGLSNWYLRRSRDRFDGSDPDAQHTLYAVLMQLSRLIAPFVPFMADGIWQSLRDTTDAESVHLADWPTPNDAWQEPTLSADMALIRELASLGLNARADVGVRVRQPLSAIEVILPDPARGARLGELLELVREELNVREVRLAAEAERFVTFRVKPDFKALGARLGKEMKAVAGALAQMDGGEVRRQALAGTLVVGGHALSPSDVLVEVVPREGFRAAGSALAVVALHTELDEDLLEEGLMREIVSRVQAGRKQLGVGYGDIVHVGLEGGPRTARVLARYSTAIAQAARCVLEIVTPDATEATVDGETFRISVSP